MSHWPQYVYLALAFLALGLNLAKHGEPKTGTVNFWVSLVGLALVATLLWFGGFFAGML
jgi:LPXTG-motif cell wall-anchored protein